MGSALACQPRMAEKSCVSVVRKVGLGYPPNTILSLIALPPNRKVFNKQSRLLTRSGYQRVFSNSIKSADGYFTVIARENGLFLPRLGLLISRKCSNKAVERNRLKRIARESFRSIQNEIDNLDFVVIGRHKSTRVSNDILRSSLLEHFAHIDRVYAKSDPNIT